MNIILYIYTYIVYIFILKYPIYRYLPAAYYVGIVCRVLKNILVPSVAHTRSQIGTALGQVHCNAGRHNNKYMFSMNSICTPPLHIIIL